jgi:cytochrome b involved in lipid metabolism
MIVGYSWTTAAIFPSDSIQNSTHADKPLSKTSNAQTTIDDDTPDPPRNFTLEQLIEYNGTKDEKTGEDKPVYLSMDGIVFDVSKGRDFYGPGGPYEKVRIVLVVRVYDVEIKLNIN